MKNTYDILVNFKKYPYEFYEWNKTDDIKHIKQIPTFKVSDSCLMDFINNDLIVEKEFLKKIENKTEIFLKGLVKLEKYACILFCDYKALAFLFDENGNLLGKSNLLFDEEEDVITSCDKLEEIKINYEIISKNKIKNYYTRKEKEEVDNLISYLNNLYSNKQNSEIKYIYFECFNKQAIDDKKAFIELLSQVKYANNKMIKKLNSLINVLKK